MSDSCQLLRDFLDAWSGLSAADRPEHSRAILDAAGSVPRYEPVVDPELWRDYLEITGHYTFLQALPDSDHRLEWSETAARAIVKCDYRLRDMLYHRVEHQPESILFQDLESSPASQFSYRLIGERVRSMAAAFLEMEAIPRVAILASNSVDSACCDLACLCHDILVTPLNIHFTADIIVEIFDQLGINIAVTDNPDLYDRLLQVRDSARTSFSIYTIGPLSRSPKTEGERLGEVAFRLSPEEVESTLAARPRMAMDDVATVMFTSGSTGRPKGICFSQFNLVSKRFARAAALPNVGQDECLVCFLPLFHTFGRYFELLGTIYWRGTYVFPGNPSAETLLSLLPGINPTGLISVPLRWLQIQERCRKDMDQATSEEAREEAFRAVVGRRLHWGLSAAGYLPSAVFQFFNQHGVSLCSGFGMTEATGGITMTPPGDYHKNSIGVPLPGVRVRQSEEGEMQIAGWYVARYLDKLTDDRKVPIDMDPDPEYWLPTGDLFRMLPGGHYEIVDRLKDIYKNNRGQTVAPRKVEKKFEHVPGIKKTFLVGDARAYNVLLIVPDRADPVLEGLSSEEAIEGYFGQIAANANKDLAPYERVVNFAILERDFDLGRDELTPKGSFRRKKIVENFSETIDELYRGTYIVLKVGIVDIKIPRWFFRDLGILVNDLEATDNGLVDHRRGSRLTIVPGRGEGWYRIGDMEYELADDSIDIGLLTRQPGLWVGNPALVGFCPCREGWDYDAAAISHRLRFPDGWAGLDSVDDLPEPQVRNHRLARVAREATKTLAADAVTSVAAVRRLGGMLSRYDERLAHVIRHRLEALAYHPEFGVRSEAYQVLLLDKPSRDYSRVLPAFIDSGLPFLNEESISSLASVNLKRRRLEALRQRLFTYRTTMAWPVSEATRLQFDKILHLLTDFARYHPEFYDMVRAELSAWILHHDDPALSHQAEGYFSEAERHFEDGLAASSEPMSEDQWRTLVVLGEELAEEEEEQLHDVICGTTFLKQSVMLAFDEEGFDLDQIPPRGIWISRILSRRRYLRYRVSVSTVGGKHFDLQFILNRDVTNTEVLETIYWLMTISSFPYGARVLPRLGCCRPSLGARSLAYQGDLTVWEKIREFSPHRLSTTSYPREGLWRKLFIRGLAAFFRAWNISGRRIVPGAVVPENVVVPEQDYREASMITSLTGWQPYKNTLCLVAPMLKNFFSKTAAHYPWCRELINPAWIFDACVEELGQHEGRAFLEQLRVELGSGAADEGLTILATPLKEFLSELDRRYYVPLAVHNAIDRYRTWARSTPQSTSSAREQFLQELCRLYRFDRLDDVARYYLHRHTYFDTADLATADGFERLIHQMASKPEMPATQMLELSELQSAIGDPDDRRVFTRLVFPLARPPQQVEIMAVGESEKRQVIVTTQVSDSLSEIYTVRAPVEPAEIGELYRQFFKAGFPKTVTEHDRFLIVVDRYEQIVGGLCYRLDGDDVVHLDGSTVASTLSGRGIGSALLEDFCTRMTNEGMRVIKTHFLLRNFYTKRGFEVDDRWGALVRFLSND